MLPGPHRGLSHAANSKRCKGDRPMANAFLRHARLGRLVLVGVGLLGLGILVGGPGMPAAAQKSKVDKKATKPKAEPQVVTDVMVPDVGGAEQVAFINQQIEKGW